MRERLVQLIPVVLTATLAFPRAAPAQGPDELAGVWIVTSLRTHDTQFSGPAASVFRIVHSDGCYLGTHSNGTVAGTYRVNKLLGELDYTAHEGPHKGKTLKCRYEVDGGTLTVAMKVGPDGVSERPNRIPFMPAEGESVWTYKRFTGELPKTPSPPAAK